MNAFFAMTGGSAEGASGAGTGVTLAMFAGIILIFYFLIIRPQRKRQKATDSMLKGIQKNDKVVTIGGIRGTITSVKDETVIVKVDANTKMEFNRASIHTVLERKDDKSEVAETEEKSDKKEKKEDSDKE